MFEIHFTVVCAGVLRFRFANAIFETVNSAIKLEWIRSSDDMIVTLPVCTANDLFVFYWTYTKCCLLWIYVAACDSQPKLQLPDIKSCHFGLEFYVPRLENYQFKIGHSIRISNENALFAAYFIFIKVFLSLSSMQFILFLRLIRINFNFYSIKWRFSCFFHFYYVLFLSPSLSLELSFCAIHFTCNDFRSTY